MAVLGTKHYSQFTGPPIYQGKHTTVAATGTLLSQSTITNDTPATGQTPKVLPLKTTAIQGIQLTNLDATDSIYLDHSSNISATLFSKKLGPGECYEVEADMNWLLGLYTYPSANTPAMRVTILL